MEVPRICGVRLTTSAPCTHGAITGIIGIPSNVSHSRIQQSLPRKLFSEQVLHAPEATCRYGAFFRRRGGLRRCGGGGTVGGGTVRGEVQTA